MTKRMKEGRVDWRRKSVSGSEKREAGEPVVLYRSAMAIESTTRKMSALETNSRGFPWFWQSLTPDP
jgi:hypothetical protein